MYLFTCLWDYLIILCLSHWTVSSLRVGPVDVFAHICSQVPNTVAITPEALNK